MMFTRRFLRRAVCCRDAAGDTPLPRVAVTRDVAAPLSDFAVDAAAHAVCRAVARRAAMLLRRVC